MALTTEEMSRLTLAELEAIAARFAAAVSTIREAQALLGGAPVAAPAAAPAAPARPVPAQNVTPEQQAELDSWRRSAARAKLMEQFKPEAPAGMEVEP